MLALYFWSSRSAEVPIYFLFPLSTCPILVNQMSTDFLHLTKILDVIIAKSDYDVKILVVMQEAGWILAQ